MTCESKRRSHSIIQKLLFWACFGVGFLPCQTMAGRIETEKESIEGIHPKVWEGAVSVQAAPAMHDGDEATFAVLTPEQREAEVAVGLEWTRPEKVNGLRVAYASLNGTAYEPLPDFQHLECWDGRRWEPLRYTVRIDYSLERKFAFYQKSGLVSWDYRFKPIEAQGIRLMLSKTRSPVRWEQHYTIREMKPYLSRTRAFQDAQILIVGRGQGKRQAERWPDLASSEWGAVRSQDERGRVVKWFRPKMVDELTIGINQLPGPVQRWDGLRWRNISITRMEVLSDAQTLTVNFLPVALSKLRVVGLPASASLQSRLGPHGRDYFKRVYSSGKDMLMERILEGPEEPDLATIASLLLPLDMHTGVIGRPGDAVECMVRWNGTLVEIENGDQGGWNHLGPGTRLPGRHNWVDRWFAFALNGKVFGEDIDSISRSYLDGYLPAVVTRYRKGGIETEVEVFTTAPGDVIYAQVVTARVTNSTKSNQEFRLSVVMGRKRSADAVHRRGAKTVIAHPLDFEPLATGYQVDPDGKGVRNQQDEIVLYADTSGQWGGSPVEAMLCYSGQLASGQTREFHFVLPSVNGPTKNRGVLEALNVERSRSLFKKYWRQMLDGKARLDLPEPPLNHMYRNLLAQTLIVLNDVDTLKYGAYFYEQYYGVEEGWPIVALAQFGFWEIAQRSIEIMLSPELMDKSNYHYQYRSGLAAMYAAQVFGLTRDRQWLNKIKQRLIETAEWIIQARHRSEGKAPHFFGLLPKHTYGGDIQTPAYSLYANATCWRGLQDIGLLMEKLGESVLAEKYLIDARQYRQTINQLVNRTVNREVSPPFVPLAFEIGSPAGDEYQEVETPYPFIQGERLGIYWNLFAYLLLETGVFPADSTPSHWITDYVEQHGGLLAGMARVRRGVDHIYGFGYPLQLYDREKHREFVSTVYSILAHGHSQDNYTAPEVGGVFPLRTDNIAFQKHFYDYVWKWNMYRLSETSVGSEPLSAGPGVALQLIRRTLLNERLDGEFRPTGMLDLLKLAPATWLRDGKQIKIEHMPTHFGEITLEVKSQLRRGKIGGRLQAAKDAAKADVVLWLRHPEGSPIKQVKLNGINWTDFTETSVTFPLAAVIEFEVGY